VNTQVQIGEKRRESRRQTSGSVRVHFSNPGLIEIKGRLIDVSSNGFRMAHGYASLPTGQIVDFKHLESSGRARVMWNRILEKSVETGFLVLNS
jgi:hypothetical protein